MTHWEETVLAFIVMAPGRTTEQVAAAIWTARKPSGLTKALSCLDGLFRRGYVSLGPRKVWYCTEEGVDALMAHRHGSEHETGGPTVSPA